MKRFLLLLPMICALPAAAHDDPVLHTDHLRLLNEVVPDEEATIMAVQSGAWSDPATWGGDMPTDESKAIIPEGVQVMFDVEAELRWLKIEGRLKWTNGTRMAVETIVVDTMGGLEIGRPSAPVVDAEILFSNVGHIVDDWTQLGRGLLVMGECSIWGREKTPWLHVANNPRGGDSELVLEEAPVNWAVGDVLVIPGVLPPTTLIYKEQIESADPDPTFRNQHEVRRIAAINGNVVRLNTPLKYDLHYQLPPGKQLAIGNLTRSVVLRSERTRQLRRGHIMFMPPAPTEYNVGYCLLKDLGRTSARMHVTDPQMENGVPIPATLVNPRGRYSLHFHKMGYESHALVEGVAIDGALKWAMSNHGSNVDCTECVSFNCEGANFNTENGLEIGSFDHNLAIYAKGYGHNNLTAKPPGRWITLVGRDLNWRNTPQERALAPIGPDTGWAGYGFWLQGPLVNVTNNETYGAMQEGLAFAQASLEKDAQEQPLKIPVSVLSPELRAALGVTAGSVDVGVPPFTAINNACVGCNIGIAAYAGFANEKGLESVFQGGWNGNCREAMAVFGIDHRTLKGVWCYFHPDAIDPNRVPRTIGFATYAGTYDTLVEDCRIENYERCLRMPEGTATIQGQDTLLKGVYGIFFDSVGRSDAVHRIELAESCFQPVDQEVLFAMYPPSAFDVTQWKIARTAVWWSKAAISWARPGEAPVYFYSVGKEPADAFSISGVQLPASRTAPGGGGR